MRFKKIYYLFLITLMIKLQPLAAEASYAQLSSLTSQAPTVSGNAFIRFDSVDALSNLTLNTDNQSIIIKEEGFYLVIASAQVGSIDATATGYVDIWIVRNGKGVPNTSCRMTVDQPTSIGTLITQGIFHFKAGDKIGTGYAASGPSLGIVFIQPHNEPAVTSFIFSMIKM